MTTTPASSPGVVTNILTILTIALSAMSAIPVIGTDAALAAVFLKIIQTGMAAYTGATGQPLDLTKIPLETPAP